MSKQYTIPAIYTAVDKMSPVMSRMAGNVAKFDAVLSRQERTLRKLTGSGMGATRQMLEFAKTGAMVAAIAISTKAIMDYETALASFRTIVSDLNDTQFAAFEKEINNVAKATNKSSIEVAASFEKIAGLNADLAKTAEGLGEVSKASITLAKASGMDLGIAAENLVGIMNQFRFGATDANRAINVLAAGQSAGAANINQTAEAFVNFGSTAYSANLTIEESVGLIQTLGKYSLFGAQAGTALRGSIIKLQKAGMGYTSGQFNMNDALNEASKKLATLKTAKEKDALMTSIFGLENITAGKILLSNIDVYKKFTQNVTGTSEAQKQAEINSKSLTVVLANLKNAWINMVTGSNATGKGIDRVKSAVIFLTNNLDTVVNVLSVAIGLFVALKTALLVTKAITTAYAIAVGVQGAVTGVASVAIGQNIVALNAYKVASAIATSAAWLFNVALSANPIGIIIIAITALIVAVIAISKYVTGWGEQWDNIMKTMGYALDAFKYTFATIWGGIVHAFLTYIDTIVLGWKWGMNKIGMLSDEQYAKDKASINAQQKLRLNAINENAMLAKLSADKAASTLEWKMKWKQEDPAKSESTAPLVDKGREQRKSDLFEILGAKNENKVSLDINNNTPYEVKGKSNNPGVSVNLGRTSYFQP